MKAITLWEPYASLIACGAKKYETRSWQTFYHHELLIHASKKWTKGLREDWDRCGDIVARHAGAEVIRRWPPISDGVPRTLGCVVAMARLIDVSRMTEPPPDGLDRHFGNFGPGRFGWLLAHVVELVNPVPWKGARGLWDAPDELVELVEDQLP